MRVDQVDFFYASMPEITDAVDGSQDALLVRVAVGDHVGWGECEASPVPSIAAWAAPASHGACRPVGASVLGRHVDSPDDIHAISADVAYDSMDLLQAAHLYSGVEVALWDALGKLRGEPVWRLLGYDHAFPKTPYASELFGDTPDDTYRSARRLADDGFVAAKFGWNGFGATDAATDALHLEAAREGLGTAAQLMVDAGQVWRTDVRRAAERLDALAAVRTTWLEEPFGGDALASYAALHERVGDHSSLGIAGGEASHSAGLAMNLIDFGRVDYIQIDTGRVGGIGASLDVARHALLRGVTYVNHTFTSSLALSASLQAFAGIPEHRTAEYPTAVSALARAIGGTGIHRDGDGMIVAPDAPGLGVDVDLAAIEPYLHTVDISVDGVRIGGTR